MTSSLGILFTDDLINNVVFDRFVLPGSHINFKVQHIEWCFVIYGSCPSRVGELSLL